MIYRKIIFNAFIALLIPIVLLIRWIPNVFNALLFGQYKYYDFRINTLGKFLSTVYDGYFIMWIISLLFIFFPFQLIKDFYIEKKGRPLSFIKKTSVLSSIVVAIILFFGSFSNIWMLPWYNNLIYLVFAYGFGLLFTTLLYFTIDKYVEKSDDAD